MSVIDIIQKSKSVIIDVRTPEEFERGHVKSSINIPLKEIFKRVEEIKSLMLPLCYVVWWVVEVNRQNHSLMEGVLNVIMAGAGWM